MKKLLVLLVILVIAPAMCYAGSIRILAVDETNYPDIRVRVFAEGDSIAELTLNTNQYRLNKTVLYGVKTVPATPDATYGVNIEDPDDFSLCNATSRSTTAVEGFDCKDTTGKYEKVSTNLTVSVDDLGAGSTTFDIDFIGLR